MIDKAHFPSHSGIFGRIEILPVLRISSAVNQPFHQEFQLEFAHSPDQLGNSWSTTVSASIIPGEIYRFLIIYGFFLNDAKGIYGEDFSGMPSVREL